MSLRRTTSGFALLLMLSACGTAAPAGSTTPTGTPASGASPSAPAATASAVASPPASAPASQGGLVGDPDLAAKFPTQVAGKPVSSVTTAKLVDFMTALSVTPDEVEQTRQSLAAVGIDMNTVLDGSATANVDGSPVSFTAIRVPGQDASKIIPIYIALSASNQGDKVTQETNGGKSVSVVRSATGYASGWLYANGDILWAVDTSDQTKAGAVLSALP